jgi:RND family efflux transporter MFP subunit
MPRIPHRSRAQRGLAPLVAYAALAAGAAAAQGQPVPVGVTEVVVHQVRPTVTVPGTVESPRISLVAAETAGRVATVHAREGTRVRAGAPLISLDAEAIELRLRAARAELFEARARLDLAERNLVRARRLFDDAILPRSGLDDAESERTAWAGRVERLDADIAWAELDLARAVVRAPFAGVVIRELAEAGEWVAVGDPCVEIQSTDAYDVRVPLPERHFAAIDRDALARVDLESLPDESFAGTIVAAVPRATEGTRTFPVKVRIADPSGRIAAGMLARVEIAVGASRAATLVPKDALVTDAGRPAAWVVGADGIATLVVIETGPGHGPWLEVVAGLAAGDRVVTRGNERLRPGQAVQPTVREYPLP